MVDNLARQGGTRWARVQGVESGAEAGGNCNSSSLPSNKLDMKDILQHCHQGGTLDVRVLGPAAQAQVVSVVESELSKCEGADVSDSVQDDSVQNNMNAANSLQPNNRKSSEQRLRTLLVLLASWHAVCLKAENFVYAKQLCTMLIDAERRSASFSWKKMIRKYIDNVQQVCKKIHGFLLDIPSAA